MAKKFNLADFVQTGNVSESDTPEIVLLPWESIHGNAANFYTVDDVEELVNSISMHGLLDPVVVMADAEQPGEYVLISGHRRHKAWGILREKEPEKWAQMPAIVRSFSSPQLGELALIMANSAARKLTAPEISRQAERTEMLFYELKEQGYEFSGRMRDQVAAACQVSSTKLARLKVIRKKLAECWGPLWEKGKLAEDKAYKLAQLPGEVQARIFKVLPGAPARNIEIVGNLMVAGTDYRCEGLTGPDCLKCTHGDAFLRHDLEEPSSPCRGETCCLLCAKSSRDYSPCGRMCSKAKERRSAENAKKRDSQEKEAQRRANRLLRDIRKSAARLIKAADAAGIGDNVNVPLNDYCHSTKTVGWIRAAAEGGDLGYVYQNDLAPKNIDVKGAAEALHCSADYICGLTEELHPGGGDWALAMDWCTEPAMDNGRYLCLVDMGGVGDSDIHEQMLDLKDGIWTAYGRAVDPDMFTVVAWWPLPRRWEPFMGDTRKEG